jgi:tRNA threonylcarbamoyladenosine dehydratase
MAAVRQFRESALFQRAGLLLGSAGLERAGQRRVLVFGLGGVGSWCAEALARTGFRHLTLVDSDVICVTNVNRQVQATARNVGAVKAEALKARLLEINPQAHITAQRAAYDEQTCAQFDLGAYDYVLDAIDSLKNKVLLIAQCVGAGVKLYSSMGAAARLDATQVRVGTLDQTRQCPLARAVRQGLRQRKVPLSAVTCVYSLEPPLAPVTAADCGAGTCLCAPETQGASGAFPDWCASKAQINGALVHVTAVFGLMLAGLVVRDTLAGASPPRATGQAASQAARPAPANSAQRAHSRPSRAEFVRQANKIEAS